MYVVVPYVKKKTEKQHLNSICWDIYFMNHLALFLPNTANYVAKGDRHLVAIA